MLLSYEGQASFLNYQQIGFTVGHPLNRLVEIGGNEINFLMLIVI